MCGGRKAAGGMLCGRTSGSSVGSVCYVVVVAQHILSLPLIYYCLVYFEKKLRKTFLKKVEPRDLFPVPILFGFISISLVFSSNAHHPHTTHTCGGQQQHRMNACKLLIHHQQHSRSRRRLESRGASSKRWPAIKIRGHLI